MLPFPNALTNENPFLDHEAQDLNAGPYVAFALIASNLIGILPAWYSARIACYFQSAVIAGSVIVSILYHLCQLGGCIAMPYIDWVRADHITAPMLMVFAALFIVQVVLSPLYRGDRMLYDPWSSFSTYFLLLIVILAALEYPFSFQAFLLVGIATLFALYMKLALIDRGPPPAMTRHRVSPGDLVLAVILALIGIGVYIADSFAPSSYWITHSLWHAAIYAAYFFYLVGLSQGLPHAFALLAARRA